MLQEFALVSTLTVANCVVLNFSSSLLNGALHISSLHCSWFLRGRVGGVIAVQWIAKLQDI